MGNTYQAIDDVVARFIGAQHLFFVATAPARGGHVNLSPKGAAAFRILDPQTVAYLDLTGSGVETIAHLRDDGRITIMFCAFDGSPKIVRLYGRGEVVCPGHPEFAALAGSFPRFAAVRSVIRVALERVSESCGYGVPLYDYAGERPQLAAWADRKGPAGIAAYRRERNAASIDGLPGLDPDEPSPG